jgi:hypothetical protein
MELHGIVTSFRVTGNREDEAGLRYVCAQLRARGDDYSVVVKALPSQLSIKAGDEITVEIDPAKASGKFLRGLPERVKVTKKGALRPVTIEATIAELAWPKGEWDLSDEQNFGAKIRVRNPLVENPRDKGAYISFVKGNAPAGVKVKRGSHVALTGLAFPRHNGTAEIILTDCGVVIRPDKPPSNPTIVAAKRALRVRAISENANGSCVDYVRLLTASRREKLERELGHEWPVLIAKDRSLLDGDAFERWDDAFKTALSDACSKIKSGLSDLESDLLACDISADAIDNVMAKYYPNEKVTEPGVFSDAMFMVRAGHISFVQARRLNELGHFFRSSISPALGALWDYVHVALDGGNSTILLNEARQWLRMQDGFDDGEIDEAFAAVGKYIAPAASLLGEDEDKLV